MKTDRIGIIIALILLISIIAYAPNEWGTYESQDDYWSDSNNFQNDPEIAFQNDPDRAFQELSDNPSLASNDNIMNSAFDEDPSKAIESINQHPESLDNSRVLDRVDEEISKDPTLLDNSIEAKTKWFDTKGSIAAEGNVKIASFDKDTGIITTGGPEGNTFNIQDHPGAIVLNSGKLILITGEEIQGFDLEKNPAGDILLNGNGRCDLSNLNSDSKIIIDGEFSKITIDDKVYSSGDPFRIEKKGEGITISGTDIIEKTYPDNDKTKTPTVTSEFSGSVTFYPDYKIISSGTDMELYAGGHKSLSVTEDTYYYTDKDQCTNQISCIEETDSELNIYATDDNRIEVKIFDESIYSIAMNRISDDSNIVIKKNNAIIRYSKENHLEFGGANQAVNLILSIEDESYNLKDGSIYTNNKLVGIITNLFNNELTGTYAEQSEEQGAKFSSLLGYNVLEEYPEGLSQHSDEAIPLEDFTKRFDQYQGVNSWQAFEIAAADVDTESIRYVVDPVNPDLVIDMEHFMKAGFTSNIGGDLIEIGQAITEGGIEYSAGNPQDFYSNALGADFFYGGNYNPFSKKTLSEQIYEYLQDHPQ